MQRISLAWITCPCHYIIVLVCAEYAMYLTTYTSCVSYLSPLYTSLLQYGDEITTPVPFTRVRPIHITNLHCQFYIYHTFGIYNLYFIINYIQTLKTKQVSVAMQCRSHDYSDPEFSNLMN